MKESIMAKACIINEYGAEGILAARKGAGGKQERALITGGGRCQHLLKREIWKVSGYSKQKIFN
jgi:hypothetical protein